MKSLLLAVTFVLSTSASAACVTSGTISNCYDNQSGNSYSTTRLGNQSFTNGYNASTGSNWRQNTNNVGDTSYTNGTNADGKQWNKRTTRVGNTSYTNGTDSEGNSFSYSCNEYGCN